MQYALMSFTNFFFAVIIFPCALYFYMSGKAFVLDWSLFSITGNNICVSMMVDGVSLLFSFTVLFIAANVYLFSIGYMVDDPFSHRFSQLLFLFILSMNFLIFSPNLIGLLLGWDGLGLTSFLLVVYYQSSYAAGAGLTTALTNRLGDVAIIVSITVFMHIGSWHIFSLKYCWFCVGLIILAAMTKSAQFPFCSWLPLAMAAPTPVSALVHSSTLVTAGVYLLIRFYPVFGHSNLTLNFLVVIGSVTMFLAGVAAFVEYDFKKVVAYSTLSQLGVMVLSLGLGLPGLTFFHLLTHAMFKALLFLCVGVLIHSHGHAQDLRTMGNLTLSSPFIQTATILSSLALCGFPFLSGFYSKDMILEHGLSGEIGWIVLTLVVISTVLTTSYSVRAIIASQLSMSRQISTIAEQKSPEYFTIPISMLTGLSVIWGASLNWLLTPTMPAAPTSYMEGYMALSMIVAGFVFVQQFTAVSLWELSCGPLFTTRWQKTQWMSKLSEDSFATLWFLSGMSSQYAVNSPLNLGQQFLASIDQGWVEVAVSQGVHETSQFFLRRIRTAYDRVPTVALLFSMVIVVPFTIISVI